MITRTCYKSALLCLSMRPIHPYWYYQLFNVTVTYSWFSVAIVYRCKDGRHRLPKSLPIKWDKCFSYGWYCRHFICHVQRSFQCVPSLPSTKAIFFHCACANRPLFSVILKSSSSLFCDSLHHLPARGSITFPYVLPMLSLFTETAQPRSHPFIQLAKRRNAHVHQDLLPLLDLLRVALPNLILQSHSPAVPPFWHCFLKMHPRLQSCLFPHEVTYLPPSVFTFISVL